MVGTRFSLAARRFSSWLEVNQGAVAFQRSGSEEKGAGTAVSPVDSGPVLVKAGEYAVAADGIPLKKYTVTDLLNMAHPLPLNIDWFGYYGQPFWYVHPDYVQQVQATNTFRTFHVPEVRGSILLSGTVEMTSAKAGLAPLGNGGGFAVGLSGVSDSFLACVQWKDGHSVLQIVDTNMTAMDEIPVAISSWPVCQLKFELERGTGRQAIIHAKVWSGSSEPQDWQLSKTTNLQGTREKLELRLVTQDSACKFENISAFLTE